MKIVSISDVHVSNDFEILKFFFNHSNVKDASIIIFNGDIFDLMIGPHYQYGITYNFFFIQINKWLQAGKIIYYVEGNHDFHLEKLFKKLLNNHKNFYYGEEFKISHPKVGEIYFSHGDDLEIDNKNHLMFKKIVKSTFMKWCAENIIPYFLMKSLGEFLSEKSRNRNDFRYKKCTNLKVEDLNKFRKYAENKFKLTPFSKIILGHSHAKDIYHSPLGFHYLNNGFVQNDNCFIAIDENGQEQLIKLS